MQWHRRLVDAVTQFCRPKIESPKSSKNSNRPAFNEAKTTQAAGFLLKKAGGAMSGEKLIKLLYLAEREALVQWGRAITFDFLASTKNGPVLLKTYGFVTDGPRMGNIYWLIKSGKQN